MYHSSSPCSPILFVFCTLASFYGPIFSAPFSYHPKPHLPTSLQYALPWKTLRPLELDLDKRQKKEDKKKSEFLATYASLPCFAYATRNGGFSLPQLKQRACVLTGALTPSAIINFHDSNGRVTANTSSHFPHPKAHFGLCFTSL